MKSLVGCFFCTLACQDSVGEIFSLSLASTVSVSVFLGFPLLSSLSVSLGAGQGSCSPSALSSTEVSGLGQLPQGRCISFSLLPLLLLFSAPAGARSLFSCLCLLVVLSVGRSACLQSLLFVCLVWKNQPGQTTLLSVTLI